MAEKENIYWKDAEKISLVSFDQGGHSDEEARMGWNARNGLNKTLLELFKKDDTIIPELTTKEVKKPADFARLASDVEYRNKNLYPARAKLSIEPAVYSKDYTSKDGTVHEKGSPVLKKDGSQAYNIKAEWLLDTDALTLNLTEKGEITNISARTGIAKGQKPAFLKAEEIEGSDICSDFKALAHAISEDGMKKTYSRTFENDALENFFHEAKKYLKENSREVTRQNKNGEEFKTTETYVRAVSDDYGEKMQIANSVKNDTIIELGVAQVGKGDNKSESLYVKATHFEGKGVPAQRAYFIDKADAEDLLEVPEMQELAISFMKEHHLEGSLYAMAQSMNCDFEESGIRDDTYAIYSNNKSEKNGHVYEQLSIVDDGMAAARITRDTHYEKPIFRVEAIDPNREEGEKAKTVLVNEKNVDKLFANPEVKAAIKEIVNGREIAKLRDSAEISK